MTRPEVAAPMTAPASLARRRDELIAWLNRDALPLWWGRGADRRFGGFHDRLDLEGRPVAGDKRARVQARQVFCYATAPALGWRGDWREVMNHGLAFLASRHRRPDGLYRTLVRGGAARPDADDVDLYDQGFVLLALASVGVDREAEATGLLARLDAHPDGGFRELGGEALLANPNMHLFEAFLAWVEAGGGPDWRRLAEGQARLAATRLIDPEIGALGEEFGDGWRAPTSAAARRVWPGHQFEWAWLLMRWSVMAGDGGARDAALRLLQVGESRGIDARGRVINALDGALTPVDLDARLWPQTERLKAAALAARLTGETEWWQVAESAARTLGDFLAVDRPGLWRDRVIDGAFVDEPAPASSLYHIVAAIQALDGAVGG